MPKFSWLELSKALIVIAAWIIRTKHDKEARDAAKAELIALFEKETANATKKAEAARKSVRDAVAADPDSLRAPDEFQRPPSRPERDPNSTGL